MIDIKESFNAHWKLYAVESEIQMWDFFGGRQAILKYLPQQGTIIEAGSGLGRYVYYLHNFGYNILGVEYSDEALSKCNEFSRKYGYPRDLFIKGDVTSLPFPSNSIAGYISLGVIEHFEEGPQKVLDEAYRVLRPGGIAIITTPNKYLLEFQYGQVISKFKNFVKCIINPFIKHKFKLYKWSFQGQYYYSKKDLVSFSENTGFKVINAFNLDLKYAIYQILKNYNLHRNKKFLKKLFKLLYFLEKNRHLVKFGLHSVVILLKEARSMHCFLSGKYTNKVIDGLHIPIDKAYIDSKFVKRYGHFYRYGILPKFNINDDFSKMEHASERCIYCSIEFKPDLLFNDFGLSHPICKNCLKEHRIEIAHRYLKYNFNPR